MKTRGDSGLDINMVMDDKITIVGVNPNVYPSCKTDGAGRKKSILTTSETEGAMKLKGAYTENAAIDNSGDHHGGVYTIVTMNKFCVDSGAGGIHLTAKGNINLLSADGLINLVGPACVTLASNVINLAASEIVTIKGTALYVTSKSVFFMNSVAVGKNVLLGGGLSVNGELYAKHLTMPLQKRSVTPVNYMKVFFNSGLELSGSLKCKSNPVQTEGGPAMPATTEVTLTLNPATTEKSLGKTGPHYHDYLLPACSLVESPDKASPGAEGLEIDGAWDAKPIQHYDGNSERLKTQLINAFTDLVSSLF